MWAAPRCLVPGAGAGKACWNPVLYQVPRGPLLLFFKEGENCSGWTGKMMRSRDAGETFGAVEAIPPGYWGPIRNRPVMLRDGSLLCGSSTEFGRWEVHFERTTTLGRTWTRTASVADDWAFQAIQPTLLAWPSGLLQALCRTRSSGIVQTFSADDGQTWMPLEPTGLPNPNSSIDAVLLSDGRALLVYGTQGDASTNRALLARARLDQQILWYECGDMPDVVADTQLVEPASGAERWRIGNRPRHRHLVE